MPPYAVKLHAVTIFAVALFVMAIFQTRAASPKKQVLPKAEDRDKVVKGTPVDREQEDRSFETATFGIG